MKTLFSFNSVRAEPKMNSSNCLLPFFLSLHCFLLLWQIFIVSVQAQAEARKNQVSAFYVFGDSSSDAGNNNYLETYARANFPPYGRDFEGHKATGRFSDGLLVFDLIASYLGFRNRIPAYLDPNLGIKHKMNGAVFASAASGYDPLTPTLTNVLTMPDQLGYFRMYKTQLKRVLGKKRTEHHIKNALYMVAAGTNDFTLNYYGIGSLLRQHQYAIPAYQKFLLRFVRQFIMELWMEGARKMAVYGLPPIGCLPAIITRFSGNAIEDRKCNNTMNSIARNYNKLLKHELKVLQHNLAASGARITYVDAYGSLFRIVHGKNHGFENVNLGCCGTGLIEAAVLCTELSGICAEPSKYVFFDSMHPTERVYRIIFNHMRPAIESIVRDKPGN